MHQFILVAIQNKVAVQKIFDEIIDPRSLPEELKQDDLVIKYKGQFTIVPKNGMHL